jgi:predicted ferric reductase
MPQEAMPVRREGTVVGVGVTLGGVLALAPWIGDLSGAPHGSGAWLTAGGRVTGLVAGYGLGVVLLLMSRAPWLERRIGIGRLAGWHSRGGRYVLILLILHTVLTVAGYAATARTALIAESVTLLTRYPDVLAATAATGLLLAIGLVSIRAVFRRLRYETWYYLHLYTYLAAALAFSHEFAVGADFSTHLVARIGWAAFYLAVAATVAWFRFWIPLRGVWLHRLRVTKVRHETRDVVTLIIAGRRLDRLRAEPGQFFRWRFLTRDGWWQSHPFSLSAAPSPRELRITVRARGDHTRQLQSVRPGTRVLAEGPYGALRAGAHGRSNVLLLAGGIGITPLRALLEALATDDWRSRRDQGVNDGKVLLLYRVSQEGDLVFRHELDRLHRQHGIDVRYLVGPRGSAADVLEADRLRREVPDISRREVFVTGPPGFVDRALSSLVRSGVPRQRVHVERFGW